MIELEHRGEPVDYLTLNEVLKTSGQLEKIGGPGYLSALLNEEFSSAHAGYYSKIIKEKSILRKVIGACSENIADAFGKVGDLPKFLDQTQARLFAIADNNTRGEFAPIKKILVENFKRIEKLHSNKSAVTGLSTGFIDFDTKVAGLQPGALYIIAARPAMGKTSLVMNMAAHAAIKHDKSVAIFSLEMAKEELGFRLLTSEARVDNARLKVGNLSDADWRKLTLAAGKLNNAKIFIDDSTDITITEMRSKARRMKARHGLSLVIVDYLQLMSGTGGVFESRERVISDVSRGLKGLAKELQIPVIALSQLNRGLESRTDKRPMLSDLRESGAIEQDADLVAFVYRDSVYDKQANPREAELLIAKHRAGSTGSINLTWLGEYTTFENYASEKSGAQFPPPNYKDGPAFRPFEKKGGSGQINEPPL